MTNEITFLYCKYDCKWCSIGVGVGMVSIYSLFLSFFTFSSEVRTRIILCSF